LVAVAGVAAVAERHSKLAGITTLLLPAIATIQLGVYIGQSIYTYVLEEGKAKSRNTKNPFKPQTLPFHEPQQLYKPITK